MVCFFDFFDYLLDLVFGKGKGTGEEGGGRQTKVTKPNLGRLPRSLERADGGELAKDKTRGLRRLFTW